jgi:hypothetical protein
MSQSHHDEGNDFFQSTMGFPRGQVHADHGPGPLIMSRTERLDGPLERRVGLQAHHLL